MMPPNNEMKRPKPATATTARSSPLISVLGRQGVRVETLPDRILALVQRRPGLTDREITDVLVGKGAPQQHVNQTCNRLHARGLLLRPHRADGKIGNYPAATAAEGARLQPRGPADSRPAEDHGVQPNAPLHWSAEIPFRQDAIRRSVPHSAGVYKLLQSTEYARYKGSTRVLKIGRSDSDLSGELLNHFQRHAVANRLMRVRGQPGLVVTVTFAETNAAAASVHERELLKSFEDGHWDLPVLNSQRGYERGGYAHYRRRSVH